MSGSFFFLKLFPTKLTIVDRLKLNCFCSARNFQSSNICVQDQSHLLGVCIKHQYETRRSFLACFFSGFQCWPVWGRSPADVHGRVLWTEKNFEEKFKRLKWILRTRWWGGLMVLTWFHRARWFTNIDGIVLNRTNIDGNHIKPNQQVIHHRLPVKRPNRFTSWISNFQFQVKNPPWCRWWSQWQ